MSLNISYVSFDVFKMSQCFLFNIQLLNSYLVAILVTRIKTIFSERGDVVSGNPSSEDLLSEGGEHLSHNALTLQKDTANIDIKHHKYKLFWPASLADR